MYVCQEQSIVNGSLWELKLGLQTLEGGGISTYWMMFNTSAE